MTLGFQVTSTMINGFCFSKALGKKCIAHFVLERLYRIFVAEKLLFNLVAAHGDQPNIPNPVSFWIMRTRNLHYQNHLASRKQQPFNSRKGKFCLEFSCSQLFSRHFLLQEERQETSILVLSVLLGRNVPGNASL